MYHFWRQNPLFRPALAFTLGIILYDTRGWDPFWLLHLGLFVSAQLFWQRFDPWKRVSGTLPCIFLLLGASFHSWQPAFEEAPPDEKIYLLEIHSEPVLKEKTTACEAQILGYDSLGTSLTMNAIRIKLLFYEDSMAVTLLPGDRLLVSGKLKKISAPLNPNTFDYAAFMERHGVFYQLGLTPGEWKLYDRTPSIVRLAIQWRNMALSVYEKRISDPENKAIIKALICGYVQELVPEIRDVYVKSGTMHMLSVSGMHVGILLIILGRTLFWLKNPVVKNILLILILWLYALLTGLSPSVMRAVSMCTLYLIGESIHKKHSTWNAVAFALLGLLAWDTHFLFNAGFQLSFLALCGILLVTSGNVTAGPGWKEKVKAWLRSYLAMSLSAQLATSPVAIYYFHQFPVYFLIGNLLIVPLAAPMMYAGLLLLVLEPFPFLAEGCAWFLNMLLGLCQYVALEIAELPGASFGNIQWNMLLVFSLYILLIGFVLKVKIGQDRGLFLGSILLCFSAVYSSFHLYERKNQSGLIVYSVYGKSACDLYAGNRMMYFGDSLEETETRFSLQPFRNAKGLEELVPVEETQHAWGTSLRMDSLRILRFWGRGSWELPSSPIPTVLILEKDAECRPADLLDSVNFCNIVLAGNLSWKSRKYWLEHARELNIPIHDVRVDGAFQRIIWKHS